MRLTRLIISETSTIKLPTDYTINVKMNGTWEMGKTKRQLFQFISQLVLFISQLVLTIKEQFLRQPL
jgi:hypothetical protein